MQEKYDISKPFPQFVNYQKKRYEITLPFDRVISFFNLFEDNDAAFSDVEKLEIGYAWLIKSKRKISAADKLNIMQIVLDNFINFRKNNSSGGDKVISFSQDSAYIYGSFMDVYGIDLFDVQGRLHWWKFLALFDALPEESKIKQVMSIRAREIPTPNGHNSELIQHILRQKKYYALEVPQEQLKVQTQNALAKLFDTLLAKAGDERGEK